MFKASKIEHSYAPVSAAAYENINAVGTKSYVEDFFIVSN